MRCDVLVVGASLGGVAAARAAAASGARVVLLEASDWIGGQLTAQGVCTPDDTPEVETCGATRAYQTLRNAIRDHYRPRLRAPTDGPFNPGDNWVSNLSVEPRVAEAILYRMLSDVPIHLNTPVQDVITRGAVIQAIVANGEHFEADVYLDATDLGDLLPLCGAEHDAAPPFQPFTIPFILERRPPGENHTIPRPDGYDGTRYSNRDGAMTGTFTGEFAWWTYRRLLNAEKFVDVPYDLAAINTNANDYALASLPGPDDVAQARRLSLGYVHWLQTACDGTGYPELRLAREQFGTADGLAPQPYIRESRRVHALYTLHEDDLGREFDDSIAIGNHAIDIHRGVHEPDLYVKTRPFQIPLRSMLPVRMRNLLPACKNLGYTHFSSAACRVHSVEWAVGEAAGHLAAFCPQPHDVNVRAFQQHLQRHGVPIRWPAARI